MLVEIFENSRSWIYAGGEVFDERFWIPARVVVLRALVIQSIRG